MERTIRFATMRAPDARDIRGMKNWVQKRQLSKEESRPLLYATDYVALVEKTEEGWLDEIVEQALSKCFPRDVLFFSVLAILLY